MLVLSRKSTEKISIGDEITIEVRRIAGNRVTLAIDAPRDIRILRGELEKAALEFEISEEETPAPAETYRVSHSRVPATAAFDTVSTPTTAVG